MLSELVGQRIDDRHRRVAPRRLGATYVQQAVFQVDVAPSERQRLRDAQPSEREGCSNRAVLVTQLGKQPVDLRAVEVTRLV